MPCASAEPGGSGRSHSVTSRSGAAVAAWSSSFHLVVVGNVSAVCGDPGVPVLGARTGDEGDAGARCEEMRTLPFESEATIR